MSEQMPKHPEELGGRVGSGSGWVRVWLTCIVFYYPVFWTSLFLLYALPALLRVGLLGHQLKFLELSFFYAIASSAPPAGPGDPSPVVSPPHGRALADAVPVVLGATLLLGLLARRHRLASGLVAAVLACVALPRIHSLRFLRDITPGVWLASVFFFAVLCLGLRWMLVSEAGFGYWQRVSLLFAASALPTMVLIALMSLLRNFWSPIRFLVALASLAAASLLVSLRPPRPAASQASPTGWKTIGLGLATTLLLVAGIDWGGRALNRVFERRRLAANHAALASIPAIPSHLPYPKLFFQKGVNFTAEFPDVYASEGARRMLETLPRYGVNAVALVPYAWSGQNKTEVRIGAGSWESDEGLEELSRVAHARGIKVLLKPAVWEAIDLELPSAEDRAKWFEHYGLVLEHYARLAKQIHADVFCIGGEFTHLTAYDAEWRKLIARTRELYPGPLVYGANWGREFEAVTFWDALDYIGLQEYYPLPDDLATEAVVEKVETVQRKFQRPVIFTEAGFSTHPAPQRQPWDDSLGKISLDQQARCYEAVFRAFYQRPWFEGVYWWKVGTSGYGGPEDVSHTPWGKPAMDVVKRWYLEGGR